MTALAAPPTAPETGRPPQDPPGRRVRKEARGRR